MIARPSPKLRLEDPAAPAERMRCLQPPWLAHGLIVASGIGPSDLPSSRLLGAIEGQGVRLDGNRDRTVIAKRRTLSGTA